MSERHITPLSSEFHVLLSIAPEPSTDRDLQQLSTYVLDVLREDAQGLALGPVTAIDLDERMIELELTIEAEAASEVHQKISEILAVLERGGRIVLRDSAASRAD